MLREKLTAADGEGQQCIAAPAWIASTEPETKGSLEISALTNIKFLKKSKSNRNKISTQLSLNLKLVEEKESPEL